MSFVDEARFYVKGGDGGNGCVSFRREKYVPKGGPNGGDGGEGGTVYIRATKKVQSLIDFKYRSHFKAGRGGHGQGKDKHGANGSDLVIEVPTGSVIKDDESGKILVDLTDEGQEFIAARGGKGGLGNSHFASGSNRTPRIATDGRPGIERWLRIELKLIADIGLVGLPNAGKSSLLANLSAANPKIGDYPFTTLEPQLGILKEKFSAPYIIADIPGLIEDAHKGVGLGHAFLRHIERTCIILHVVDISEDNHLINYLILENELTRYQKGLADRVKIIVLNKNDLVDPDMVTEIEEGYRDKGFQTISVSALTGDGIAGLRHKLIETMEEIEQAQETAKDD
ncbi:MAG: GTPase ObgE [Desulfofustis sp.]|nr:GTPase ObgE [Desulfofustis sp.]